MNRMQAMVVGAAWVAMGAQAQAPLSDDVRIGRFQGLLVIEQPEQPRQLVSAGYADQRRRQAQGTSQRPTALSAWWG